MERHQTQCPNCGSAEFIMPVIDNNMAYLLSDNSPIVTVTCTHCGSKYQTDASINMVAPQRPAPAAALTTPPEPEEKSSKLTLQIVRVISIVAAIPTVIITIAMLVAAFVEPKDRSVSAFLTLFFACFATLFIALARSCGQRIIKIQKKLNNQL